MSFPSASGAPSRIPSVFLLGALAASSPLSLSIHVQSIPEIASGLGTDYATAQLTVSLYLLTFALSQLFIGPLSDKIGRRPVLFGGLSLFVLASAAAAMAPTIDILLVARVAQGFGGCAALVVPRAVVQDTHHGAEAARMMALVAMLQSTAPSVAPVLGGAIDTLFDWRMIFWFLALFGAVLLAVSAFRLSETRPLGADGRVSSWNEIFWRYGRLLGSRRYVGYTVAFAFGTSGYFGFLAVGPGLLIGEMGLTPLEFSIALTSITAWFVIGSFTASRLVACFGVDRTLYIGVGLAIVSSTTLLALAPLRDVVLIVLPMWGYGFSNGFIFPNALAGATGVDRRIAGAASSFLGFAQLGIGAALAWGIGSLPADSIVPCALALLGFSLAATLGMLMVRLSPPA